MTKEEFLAKTASLSKKDQIEIIISGFNDSRIMQESDTPDVTISEIAQSFTVTPDEFREYTKIHPEAVSHALITHEDSVDGDYLLEENGKFVSFYKEHGGRSEETSFNTYNEAIDAKIESIISEYQSFKNGL